MERVDGFLGSDRVVANYEVLSSGHEDVYGLWEIAAGVNGAVPDRAVAYVLRLAQTVVLDLLNRGLLVLRYGRELENKDSVLIPVEQHASVIAEIASWDPYARGEEDPYYTVRATPEGIAEYYQLGHAAVAAAKAHASALGVAPRGNTDTASRGDEP
jgi:hypothetical protein